MAALVFGCFETLTCFTQKSMMYLGKCSSKVMGAMETHELCFGEAGTSKTANKIIQFQRLESSDSYDSTDGSTSTLPPWVGNLEQQHEEVMENQSFLEKQQQEVLESQAVQNQSIEKNSAGVQQLLASIVPGPLGPPIATPPPGPCVPGVELTEQAPWPSWEGNHKVI